MATVAQCLQRGAQLSAVSDSAELDAQLLLAYVLDKPRSYLFTWPEKNIAEEALANFDSLLAKRLAGEPIAYLIGKQGFWSLDLAVNSTTLIPRPETELVVELAVNFLHGRQGAAILDLGTGSGAIALALAKELSASTVLGVDIDAASVDLAEMNKEAAKLDNASFMQSNWFEKVRGQFDLIVSNPPYIAEDDEHLVQGDVRFEPRRALVSGVDGLDDLRKIIANAKPYLNSKGCLMVEHGYDQREAVAALYVDNHFTSIRCVQDLAGQDRVSVGVLV